MKNQVTNTEIFYVEKSVLKREFVEKLNLRDIPKDVLKQPDTFKGSDLKSFLKAGS
ncbi:14800_t:CDS:2 [Funneliformis caledonium]|uniref:14800_t:CDS:1 n=1 Tax=Funneliformis caledonium TaxID=1117310 RepID=A0A9N8W1V7_9GLOM|nr:14800_t:CDS:2 [Funneliformis caledonium]